MKAVGGRTNERTAYACDVLLASGHQGDPFLALALVTYQGYSFSISSHSLYNSYEIIRFNILSTNFYHIDINYETFWDILFLDYSNQ